MKAAQIDVVELGFRFIKNGQLKGPCASFTDDFLRSLDVPADLTMDVMGYGANLYTDIGLQGSIEQLFPEPSNTGPLDQVRFAHHYHGLPNALSAATR